MKSAPVDPGKAQEGGRHRRRLPGQHAHAVVACIALQVDQQVAAVGVDAGGNVAVAQPAQVDEVFTGLLDAPAHGAAVGLAVRVQRHLEAAAVVVLEHLGHQDAGGVFVEVGRQVAQLQAPCTVGPPVAAPRGEGTGLCRQVARQAAGRLQLRGRVVQQRHVGERGRGHHRVVGQGIQRRLQRGQAFVGALPVAGFALEVRQQRAHAQFVLAHAHRQRGLETLRGFLLHRQVVQAQAQLVMGVGVRDAAGQCVHVGVHRLARQAAQLQRAAQREVVVVAAFHVGRQALQAARGVAKALAFHQAVRGQRTGHRAALVQVVAAHGLARGVVEAALGQQGPRQVQRIHRVGGRVARGGLETAHRVTPGLALGMRLAGLPGGTRFLAHRLRGGRKRAGLGIGRGVAHGERALRWR
jgi:hypothetical protein